MRLLALIAVALLAGCGKRVEYRDPPPLQVQMPAECSAQCDVSGIAWMSDPSDPRAWDDLAEDVIAALIERVELCETRRESCVATLRRAEAAGRICGIKAGCPP